MLIVIMNAVIGYYQERRAEAALDAGAIGFIQKPFRRNVLAAKIESALAASSDSK